MLTGDDLDSRSNMLPIRDDYHHSRVIGSVKRNVSSDSQYQGRYIASCAPRLLSLYSGPTIEYTKKIAKFTWMATATPLHSVYAFENLRVMYVFLRRDI
jgi:hypothetical protein